MCTSFVELESVTVCSSLYMYKVCHTLSLTVKPFASLLILQAVRQARVDHVVESGLCTVVRHLSTLVGGFVEASKTHKLEAGNDCGILGSKINFVCDLATLEKLRSRLCREASPFGNETNNKDHIVPSLHCPTRAFPARFHDYTVCLLVQWFVVCFKARSAYASTPFKQCA